MENEDIARDIIRKAWLVKDDGHGDYNSVHTWRHIASVEKEARVKLDEKISQIRMYLADRADATLEEGERAIFTDITTILDGEVNGPQG